MTDPENIHFDERPDETHASPLVVEESPDLRTVLTQLEKLDDALMTDQGVASESVRVLRDQLARVELDVGGVKILLRELSSLEDLAYNVDLLQRFEWDVSRRRTYREDVVNEVKAFTAVTPTIATRLVESQQDRPMMRWSDLTNLTPEIARILATYQGPTDPQRIEFMKDMRGPILEIGTEELDVETVSELVKFEGQGTLSLTGIEDFQPGVLETLSSYSGHGLEVGSMLRNLSSEEAGALSQFGGSYLSVGYTPLTVDIARELVGFTGDILVVNAHNATPEALVVISESPCDELIVWTSEDRLERTQLFQGFIGTRLTLKGSFFNLNYFDPSGLRCHELVLDDVIELSEQGAQNLIRFPGPRLTIQTLQDTSPDVRHILETFHGTLNIEFLS